jgi:phosphoglycolate phosphatase-like HAD superfamily hydrolase
MNDKLILFDIDGTLVDTAGAGRRAMERAFREVLAVDELDRAGSVPYAGRTDPVILEAVARAVNVPSRTMEGRRELLERAFLRALATEMDRPDPRRRVLPGVRPLLEKLEATKGVHLGLLTGNLEAGARIKLGAFELNRFFPAGGFSSDDRDRRRIAHIAWRKLCEWAGIEFDASAVTVVGDTGHDVDCARANGFRAVAVDSGWVSRDVLVRAAPDVLLDDLAAPHVIEALGLEA